MAEQAQRDQQHPQAAIDRQTVNSLLTGESTDYNLAELGRLRIRYQGFPGARDIQADLEKVLQKWGLTEATLHEKTREIHAAQIYREVRGRRNDEDWS